MHDPAARRSSVPSIDALAPNTQAGTVHKVLRRRLARLAAMAVVAVLAASCGSSGHGSTTTTSAPAATSRPTTTTTASTTTSTTAAATAAHGPVTVLSPIGLHVRAGPSRSAKVIGSAAQGAVFQLLAYTSSHGGWYKVLGTTLTGWISADPAYSTRGQFSSFSSPAFSVLYPPGWTQAGTPHTGVTFRSPSPTEKVVITTAASLAKLPVAAQGAGVSQAAAYLRGLRRHRVLRHVHHVQPPPLPRRHRCSCSMRTTLSASERRTPPPPRCGRSSTSSTRCPSRSPCASAGHPEDRRSRQGLPQDDRRSRQGLGHDDRCRHRHGCLQEALSREPSRPALDPRPEGLPGVGAARAVGTAQLGL